ncbi:hypothetical protein ACFWBN_16985 [Streptomyces sp. NPDC059989]|uniref:hypothetical protein n=1 Tax=Streptomyces sp. NPDC059989 TaxID=3347026 RepID=UPI0036A7FD38
MQLREAFVKLIVKHGTVSVTVGKPAANGTLPLTDETSAEPEMIDFPMPVPRPCAPRPAISR